MGPKATFLHEDKLTVLVRISGDFMISTEPQEWAITVNWISNSVFSMKDVRIRWDWISNYWCICRSEMFSYPSNIKQQVANACHTFIRNKNTFSIHFLFTPRYKQTYFLPPYSLISSYDLISMHLKTPVSGRRKQNKRKFLLHCSYRNSIIIWTISLSDFTIVRNISFVQPSSYFDIVQ